MAGLVGMCEPVRQEFLRAAGGAVAFREADGLLRELYPFHVLRDSVWEETAALQRRLAMRGWHQCASPIDLVVAVTAAHHKLTVLHNDRDLETISHITGQPVRRIE
jgi:predicted nucleic acid-binding protein